jgi:hypothetical protein
LQQVYQIDTNTVYQEAESTDCTLQSTADKQKERFAMYSILNFEDLGPVMCFEFSTGGIEEYSSIHLAQVDPIKYWCQAELLPLAAKCQSDKLKAAIVDCISRILAQASKPAAGIDWLGLSLYATQAFHEACGKLAQDENSPEAQQLARTTKRLAKALYDIEQEISHAIHSILKKLRQGA